RASVSVTITPPVLLAIDVSPANANIALNETQQFSATGHYSNSTTGAVTTNWSSSVPGVAGIDGASGLVTRVGPGTTTITATNVSLLAGATRQFTATAIFTDGSQVDVTADASTSWSSSDITIATVNAMGLATAKAIGTATIEATYNSFNASGQLKVPPEARFV